jgi:hypothetical protein
MSKTFNQIGIPNIGRSVFNLSYEKKFTGKMGFLYPTMVDECVPGDIFEIRKRCIARFLPLVAPIMHQVTIKEYTFFVPYRLLMSSDLGDDGNFYDMLIGGDDGDTEIEIPTYEPTNRDVGSLWDYLGFPIGVEPTGAHPVAFPCRAYLLIYNEFFRDIELDYELDITTQRNYLLYANWDKDYFTSARPYQQRGTSPALPISGIIDIDGSPSTAPSFKGATSDQNAGYLEHNTGTSAVTTTIDTGQNENLLWNQPALTVDVEDAITFDVNDIRLAIQTQKWMERNMRAGTRPKEFIMAHYGVNNGDARLDRPEFIGGWKTPMIISEVLQTESSDASTDLGTMAGHGINASQQYVGKYRVPEHGLIMSLLCVKPKTAYAQGIDRQWRKDTLYDFYSPEFAHLSEQPILESEIYASETESHNNTVFGYQGAWNEMRVKKNIVCGRLAYGQNLDHWTLVRYFSGRPTLNSEFISMQGNSGPVRTDIFAAPSEHQFVITIGNIIKAVRPLPAMAIPGYMDHQ